MLSLAGEPLEFCEAEPIELGQRIQKARASLMKLTGQDFGLDLRAWHDFLITNDKWGYCWDDEHLMVFRCIEEAEANPEWQMAVASLSMK